jgi:predicted HD phosphohydrolase
MMPSFTTLSTASAAELAEIVALNDRYVRELPQRLLELMRGLRGATPGMPVDALEHCCQTATRALRDGADEETVVCALVHDIGEVHAPCSHAAFAAAIVEPYVSAANCWMVRHHAIFQGYYFWHKIGGDRNARERFRGEPHFQQTADFCERWDQISFDPAYPTLPLESFLPHLVSVFGRAPHGS